MKLELATAQLCIVDGAWQESPDNLACFEEAALFGEGIARGNLYIVTEVWGEPEGRDDLARQLIETTRREYAASRGSISLALTQALRTANDAIFDTNLVLPPEARRIAGITAVVLREDELFIAQAGPGMVCVVRGKTMQRFPPTSPWFNAEERTIYDDEFSTPGAVPLGKRRICTPDLFHSTIQPGDVIAIATRTLAHLLSNEELIDTFANRHPDEIITSLDELASAADISIIVLRAAGESVMPAPATPPIFAPVPEDEFTPTLTLAEDDTTPAWKIESDLAETAPRPPKPSEEELLRQRARAEQARERSAKMRALFLRFTSGIVGALAGIFGRVNANNIGTGVDRALNGILQSIARMLAFLIRAVAPGEPVETASTREKSMPRSQTAWQLAAIIFPLVLIGIGLGAWVFYRTEKQQLTAAEVERLIGEANQSFARAEQLVPSDKAGAGQAAQKAIEAAEQARRKSPNDPRVSKVLFAAQDLRDRLNGIAIVYGQAFLTLADPQTLAPRIVANFPSVFVLDRNAGRIYRYQVGDAGASPAPNSSDGVILKTGDRVGDRVVGTLIDMAIVDAKRLVALDRSGNFLVYELERATWSARPAGDASAWSRINLIAGYEGRLYLVDGAPRNQILRYNPAQDGWWTSAVTYFDPGANPDLTNVVDLAIDGEIWLLRNTGALLQCSATRCTEVNIRDLEIKLEKPAAVFTSRHLAALYIADAGNQRIVQIDKNASRFARQYKPSAQSPDTFRSLRALTADDKNFYFVSGTRVYIATITQSQ